MGCRILSSIAVNRELLPPEIVQKHILNEVLFNGLSFVSLTKELLKRRISVKIIIFKIWVVDVQKGRPDYYRHVAIGDKREFQKSFPRIAM
ncbi:hypothetical protein CEXT_99341 [Caerostris extrusa]|uniref:Uncharacterized protein n=1 Tax=Caerostris extrusa TaxID=172846 RepID=A0AAV4XJS4_CAEEX|nr:hypothetical protein CEXT_99341 [Caerostris extrusa]